MISNSEVRPTSLSSVDSGGNLSLEIIEISSDSEDEITHRPLPRCGPTQQGQHKHNRPRPTWGDDVIELTDSDSSNLSVLPDILSPLVKESRRKKLVGSKQRSSKNSIPLYADTDDDIESDADCILVLNDPPGSRRPIPFAKDVANDNSFLYSPKKNTVPEFLRALGKSPSQRVRKVKEQARRQNYAANLFTQLNKDVFGDRLPKNTTLEWNKRLLTTAGRARWHCSREGVHITKIELASKILDCDERIRNTLSHEMCHLACWVIDNHPREGHGQLFKSWANRVMHKHPDIHISTRHNYEILYPYEWKCEKCSKIYGRYSKSIRPDECVCGACKAGRLIPLFVERKPATSKVSRMTVAKPRDSLVGDGTTLHLTNTVDKNIPDLVNAFRGISINNSMDQ